MRHWLSRVSLIHSRSMSHSWPAHRILLYIAAFVMPLSCLRSLNALRFTATISIGFVSFLVGVIFLDAVVPSLDACAGMVLEECS